MDIRINGSGEEAVLELPAYSVGQNKTHVSVRQISTYSLIDYNGIYGTEIVLKSGQRVRAGCYPDDLSRAITASSHATNTRTNEVLRLTRERDDALAEVERLREHHKVAVDWWMQEAQSVKPLTEEVERLREERDYYRRDNEKLHNALAWEHNESENAMDARRYRWLRDFQNLAITREVLGEYDTLDAAIDAAMREGK